MPLDLAGLGTSAGQLFGGPVGALVGGAVGGLLTPGPKLPAELKRLYRFQYGQADQMRRFAQSVPLSDPAEQAALASQRGLLGEQQRNDTANLTSQYNTFAQGNNGAGDFLTNINNQQQGQQSALYGGAMQNALDRRFQAIGGAANIAQGAVGAASQYQTQPSLAGSFGDLARLIAYNQTLNANRHQQKNQDNQGNANAAPADKSDKAGSQAPGEPPPGPTSRGQGTVTPGEEQLRPYPYQGGQPFTPSPGPINQFSPSDILLKATGRAPSGPPGNMMLPPPGLMDARSYYALRGG